MKVTKRKLVIFCKYLFLVKLPIFYMRCYLVTTGRDPLIHLDRELLNRTLLDRLTATCSYFLSMSFKSQTIFEIFSLPYCSLSVWRQLNCVETLVVPQISSQKSAIIFQTSAVSTSLPQHLTKILISDYCQVKDFTLSTSDLVIFRDQVSLRRFANASILSFL